MFDKKNEYVDIWTLNMSQKLCIEGKSVSEVCIVWCFNDPAHMLTI